MAFHVRDPETDTLVRELARKRGVGITDAIKQAVGAELKREAERPTQLERIRAIQAEIAKLPRSGVKVDRALFDWISGEEDI